MKIQVFWTLFSVSKEGREEENNREKSKEGRLKNSLGRATDCEVDLGTGMYVHVTC